MRRGLRGTAGDQATGGSTHGIGLLVPPPRNQFSEDAPPGYRFHGSDCWATVGAWLGHGATHGEHRPSAPAIRKAAGKERGPGPGNVINIHDALAALGISCRKLMPYPADDFLKIIRDPHDTRLLAVATDFRRWPEDKKCQPDFDGEHMVGVIPGGGPHGIRVMNPLCADYERVFGEEIVRAAGQYASDHGFGDDTVCIAWIWRPRPRGAPRRAHPEGDPRDARLEALETQLAEAAERDADQAAAFASADALLEQARAVIAPWLEAKTR